MNMNAVTKFVLLMAAVLPFACVSDMPPMSFDEWRLCCWAEDSAPEGSEVETLTCVLSGVGIAFLAALLFVCRVRKDRWRVKVVLWSLAVACVAIVGITCCMLFKCVAEQETGLQLTREERVRLASQLPCRGRESDVKLDLPPPTEKERKGYARYLRERNHCTKCGSTLRYEGGRYCPKCQPGGKWRFKDDQRFSR